MEKPRIKAVMYGVGAMGKIITRLLVDQGVEIVGAIGHTQNIGLDLGDVAEVGHRLNVVISNDADQVLGSCEADIVVMSFCGDMQRMVPAARLCIEHGKNVLSLSEESFYPWSLFPEQTSELDQLAKRYGVTVSGGGIQDLIWFSLISTLTAVCQRIDSMTGEASANVNEFGPAVAAEVGMGLSPAEFADRFNGDQLPPTPFGVALEAVVADLGFTVASRQRRMEPILAARDVESTVLGQTILAGRVLGCTQVDELHTCEGPVFRGEFHVRPYDSGETDYCHWRVKGTPDAYLDIPILPGQLGTCTMVVNRIPDVINAAPGFVTVAKLPRVKFRALPLHVYVNRRMPLSM